MDDLPTLAAAAAAAASRTTPVLKSITLTSRLQSNDPSLRAIQLYKNPVAHFNDLTQFIRVLRQNTTVTKVELSWRFLRELADEERPLLLRHLGGLPALQELELECAGHAQALTIALEQATRLQSLRVGALRFSCNEDVLRLARTLERHPTLQQVSLSSVRVTVLGNHRMDPQGSVWFQEDDNTNEGGIVLDPLFQALANIPSLKRIHLQLGVNARKFKPIEIKSLRQLCRKPRQILTLHACGLIDHQILALTQELSSSSSSLAILILTRNPLINPRAWEALSDVLAGNSSLLDLQTDAPVDGGPGITCRAQMDYYLKLNRAGRKALFAPRVLCDKWVGFILQGGNKADDLDLLFYALQTNPSLCVKSQ